MLLLIHCNKEPHQPDCPLLGGGPGPPQNGEAEICDLRSSVAVEEDVHGLEVEVQHLGGGGGGGWGRCFVTRDKENHVVADFLESI